MKIPHWFEGLLNVVVNAQRVIEPITAAKGSKRDIVIGIVKSALPTVRQEIKDHPKMQAALEKLNDAMLETQKVTAELTEQFPDAPPVPCDGTMGVDRGYAAKQEFASGLVSSSLPVPRSI